MDGAQEHMLHQGKAQGVEHTQGTAHGFAFRVGRFFGGYFEQAVKLHRVHPQPRDEAAEYACPVITRQSLGQGKAGGLQRGFSAAIGAAGPIGGVEQLAISRH